jgi:hypothetical protein
LGSPIDSASRNPQFDNIVVEAVQETLIMIFGKSTTETILNLLEKRRLSREQIPRSLDRFTSSLAGLLGSSSTSILEKLIVKHLCSKIGIEYQPGPNLHFIEYIGELKERYEK